jgi:hypothetical protein
LSIDPYEQPVKCNLNENGLKDMASNSSYLPSKITWWHHGPHLKDNYMEEIAGTVNIFPVKSPKDKRINENRFYLKYSVEALATRINLIFNIPQITLITSSGEIIFGPITFKEVTEKTVYFPGTM